MSVHHPAWLADERSASAACEATIAPTTATPSIWPIWREVVAIAEATPAWGELDQPLRAAAAEQGIRFLTRREQDIGLDPADHVRSPATPAGKKRSARGQVQTHQGPAGSSKLDCTLAGGAKRLPEQRVGGQMQQRHRAEPGGLEIVRCQLVRGAAVRYEGPLAVWRENHADATGSRPGDASGAYASALSGDCLDEGSPDGVPTDRTHERHTPSQSRHPARGCRGRPTLAEENVTGDVGASRDSALWRHDDVEQQVAEHNDMWTPGPAQTARWTVVRRGWSIGERRGHRPTISPEGHVRRRLAEACSGHAASRGKPGQPRAYNGPVPRGVRASARSGTFQPP